MVVKDEELGDIDDESLARVKIICEKKRLLEQTADQVRTEIKDCFERLSEALRGRERQLLRQVEAVHRQQLSLVQSNLDLLPSTADLQVDLDGDKELVDRLLNFGKIELSNCLVNDAEPYKVEEYLEAREDVVSFDKSLKTDHDQIDVTTVIRRKRDSSGNHSKNISINLNCASCDACKAEASVSPAATSVIKKFDDSPATPSSSSSSDYVKSPLKESEDDSSPLSETKSPLAVDKSTPTQSENVFFEQDPPKTPEEKTDTPKEVEAEEKVDEAAAAAALSPEERAKDGNEEHPIQIQQWLKQILAETETEPIIHEIGQFSEISNATLYCEFPVET